VPADAINKLVEYLSKKLRGLEEEKDLYNITDSALALYTLAKAGKPEPAYQNLLFGKRDKLPEIARLYLALSMCISNTPDQQIKDTLGWKPPAPPTPPKADSKAKVAASSRVEPERRTRRAAPTIAAIATRINPAATAKVKRMPAAMASGGAEPSSALPEPNANTTPISEAPVTSPRLRARLSVPDMTPRELGSTSRMIAVLLAAWNRA